MNEPELEPIETIEKSKISESVNVYKSVTLVK